jgi:hypothetical protein
LAENKEIDTNNDGENDAVAYYFYLLRYDINEKESTLVENIVIADYEGNRLGSTANWMKPYHETDYYLTNSGYVYLTDKDSYIAEQLDEKYTSVNRGKWASGRVFVTQKGQYILLNADYESGEWCVLDKLTSGLYFADRKTSRFAQKAVEIPAKYNNSGKLIRHAETYYPIKDKKLRFDETTGKIQAYNLNTKSYTNATFSDCAPGIWSTGAYYVIESGALIAVNEESGDWGIIELDVNNTFIADIFANDTLLNYNLNITGHTGKVTVGTTLDNFKRMYQGMLYASLEGMANITEEEMESLKQLDDFANDAPDNPCQLKVTVYGRDYKGNRWDTVYRYYQYSERRSYITVEAISQDDGFASDSTKAFSKFYVLRTYVDKMIADAKKMVNGVEIEAVTKY